MIHLISYGNNRFKNSKVRLKKEAENTNWFDSINIYGPEDLDEDFKEDFKDVLNKSRGGGYWIWKINIILKKLKDINDEDILIYMDSGCKINKSGEERFKEYINMLKDSELGFISFQLCKNRSERNWTTKEIFNYFNVDINSDMAINNQYFAGILIMKKNQHLKKILDLTLKTYYDNPLLITDHYNKNSQLKCFKDNRHDQSIFSLIRKIHGSIVISDETRYRHKKKRMSSLDRQICRLKWKYPFWAARIRN